MSAIVADEFGGTGDCMLSALTLLNEGDELYRRLFGGGTTKHLYLCHGRPIGTGGVVRGLRHWHAWVEIGAPADPNGAVIDHSNGKRLEVRRADFYRLTLLDDSLVHRYTRREARYWRLRTGIAGPWEDL